MAASGLTPGCWPLSMKHKQMLPNKQLPQQMAATAAPSRQPSQMPPSNICTGWLSRVRDKVQTCADGLHGCDGLHSACCPQQVPNHALCAVDSQILSRQGVCDGMVLCHVTCRHSQAGWWESYNLKLSGWMAGWVHVERGWAGLAADRSAPWSAEEVAEVSCMRQTSGGRQTITRMCMKMLAESRLGKAAVDADLSKTS